MKDEFVTYLVDEMHLGDAVIERVEFFHDAFEHLLPEHIEDMLLADYFLADGTREIDELWFFTGHYVGLVVNFLSDASPKLEVFNLRAHIFYYRVEAVEYDVRFSPLDEVDQPRQSSSKSRLTLTFGYPTGLGEGSIRAAAGNCDALYTIVHKYFRQWLVNV